MASLNVQQEEGVSVVNVKREDLLQFSNFIIRVEKEGAGIGSQQGVFKMRLCENSRRGSSLDQLLETVKECSGPQYKPSQQMFIAGSMYEHIYGFGPVECSDFEAKEYMRRMTLHTRYLNPKTCCTDLLSLDENPTALIQHQCDEIRARLKECHRTSKKQIRSMEHPFSLQINPHASVRSSPECGTFSQDFSDTSAKHSSEMFSVIDCEKIIVSKREQLQSILVSDAIKIEGTKINILENFSLSELKTVLDLIPGRYGRVAYPHIYIGEEHTVFCWHIEDFGMWSINFLHAGAPKLWIVVPPSHAGELDYYLSQTKINLDHTSCRNLLGHNFIFTDEDFLMRRNIPFTVVTQHVGEFIVVYPNAPHEGFNLGSNIAEAVNFGSVSWIPIGLSYHGCRCFGEETKTLDMRCLIAKFRPDLLDGYINHSLIIPRQFHPMQLIPVSAEKTQSAPIACQGPVKTAVSDNTPNNIHIEREIIRDKEIIIMPENSASVVSLLTEKETKLLSCPLCHKMYKGGVGQSKLNRLIKHAFREHGKDGDVLVETILKKYSPREHVQVKNNLCSSCGKSFAGSATHLKRHMSTCGKRK